MAKWKLNHSEGIRDYLKDYEDNRTYTRAEDTHANVTFDYNYDQYVRLETPANQERVRTSAIRLHHKVAELQKKLAEAKNRDNP